jgi:L-2-hydroxyglutarate oxidase LhgO
MIQGLLHQEQSDANSETLYSGVDCGKYKPSDTKLHMKCVNINQRLEAEVTELFLQVC